MILTISNKTLTKKPEGKKETGTYFKGINFNSIQVGLNELHNIIGAGYTIGYITKDGNNLKRKNNFKGTQFICIDVDATELDIENLINKKAKHIPTVIHTTFSNLTPRKDNKFCYHLLYVLDEIVLGEENFKHLFTYFCEGLEDIYDEAAKDCNRIIYTSNKDLPNFQYAVTGTIYNAKDILNTEVNIDKIYGYKPVLEKRSFTTSLSVNKKPKFTTTSTSEFNIKIDKEFNKDLATLPRKEFIAKYSTIYPFYTETPVDATNTENGYVDLRGTDTYKVASSELFAKKVGIGQRNKFLFADALSFIGLFPNITVEHLIYCLVRQVWDKYDNSDGKVTIGVIIQKAYQVLNKVNVYSPRTTNRSFKVDKQYWINQGKTTRQGVGIISMEMVKEKKLSFIGKNLDLSKTLDANLHDLKEMGLRLSKASLKAFINENGIILPKEKDARDMTIKKAYMEHPELSIRKFVKYLEEHEGIKVSQTVVFKVLDKKKWSC